MPPTCASCTFGPWDPARSIWSGRVRSGCGRYFTETSPLCLVASAILRLARHTVLDGSVGVLWGYFSAAARNLPRHDDPVFRQFLRHYQRQCLSVGKGAASRGPNDAQARVWSGAHGSLSRAEETRATGW